MKNTNIGSNSGIIGDGTTIIFNMQMPLTKQEVEAEFLKLAAGDFEDVTNEVDEKLHESHTSILCYAKNYWLQLKKQLVNNDFYEPWIPHVPSDMGTMEKKRQWKVTPLYQGIVFPFSYFFIEMDGGRYLIPLPRSGQCDRKEITRVQYTLGKALNSTAYDYDAMLKECKIEVEAS